MFVFWNPCARTELHQRKRARKLCSATLNRQATQAKSRVAVELIQIIPIFGEEKKRKKIRHSRSKRIVSLKPPLQIAASDLIQGTSQKKKTE